ncbi:MAG: glycine zipper 2TM domain-containing protein [Pseudomonadota bacterium]
MHLKKVSFLCFAGIAAIAVSACDNPEARSVGGAAVGAVVGNQLGSGGGRVVATTVGAAVGAGVGANTENIN